MTTRQYIGARYVPIIDGDWDITKEYDPLVIVMHQGNSYTSRTFVPSGIDIDNTIYWALTGNYNAQVEAYREEVTRLMVEVNGIDCVSVKDFGAKGDGSTDDTHAFQSALNTGKDVFVPLANGEHYLITETLYLDGVRQQIFSTSHNKVWDETCTLSSEIGCIYFTGNNHVFQVNGLTGIRFRNLTIVNGNYAGDTDYSATAMLLNATSIKDNADYLISGCAFYGFSIVLENYGRGTRFIDNSCFHFGKAFIQHYTFDGSGGTNTQQPRTGDRGIEVRNNKFHYGNLVFHNIEGILNGLSIEDNYIDGVNQLLICAASIRNSIIKGNICLHGGGGAYITFSAGYIENCIISDNTYDGTLRYVTNRFIHANSGVNNIDGIVIANNSFNGCTQDGIFLEGTIHNATINGNSILNVGSGGSNNIGGIRMNGQVSFVSVCCNTIEKHTNAGTVYFCTFTGTADNCYVEGNSSSLAYNENQANNAGKRNYAQNINRNYFYGYTPSGNVYNANIRIVALEGNQLLFYAYTGDGSLVSSSDIAVLRGDFSPYNGRVFPCFIQYSDNTTEVGHITFSTTELIVHCRTSGKVISRIMFNAVVS